MAKKRSSKDDHAWPRWLWVFVPIALAIIGGSILSGDDAGSVKGTANKVRAKVGKGGGIEGKNIKHLQLLETLSEQVSGFASEGKLDEKLSQEYLEMLDLLSGDIEGEDELAKELRDMASVIRASLIGAGKGLGDKEVEAEFNVSTYSSPRFWEQHYAGKGAEAKGTDWYVEWGRQLADGHHVKDLVGEVLRPEHDFLVLGCGNSPMSAEMYKDGYRRQHNVDVSASVIERMQQKYGTDMPGVPWDVMDAQKMTFDDGRFEGVLDKGTFDAISTDAALTAAILGEVKRVLREGASLVSIGSKKLPTLTGDPGLECSEVLELRDKPAPGRPQAETSFMHRCKRRAADTR